MMTPYRTRAAKRNLREGIKKMETVMSSAARVRREFRLGRPPKGTLPLHPTVVADKAVTLLSDFRQRMQAAGLKPQHAEGLVIGSKMSNPDEPVFIPIDRDKIIASLSAPDILALGCVFHQFDEAEHKVADFFVQFTGLNERDLNVLKHAATMWHDAQARAKAGH